MEKKASSLGMFCDVALDRYRERFGLNVGVLAVVNLVFIVFLGGLAFLGVSVVHPAVSGLTDNQPFNDLVFLAIAIPVVGFFVSAFLMFSSASAILVGAGSDKVSFGKVIKHLCRRIPAILSLAFAQSIVYLVVYAVIVFTWFNNVESALQWYPYLLGGLFVLASLQRVFSFFSLNLVMLEKKSFFGAMFASARLVIKSGLARIFIITMLITIVNLVLFGGIFVLLHSVFSNYALFHQLNLIDPLFYILFVAAYIPVIFISPRLNLIALSFYTPQKRCSVTAGLGSRTLATLADLIIPIAVSLAIYAVFAMVSGSAADLENINVGVIIIFAIAFFVVFSLYNIYFEVFVNGQTLGKRLMSLRVVSENGEPVTMLKSILRNVLRIVDIVSFIMILIDKNHHRLGDVLSATKVIRINHESHENGGDEGIDV